MAKAVYIHVPFCLQKCGYCSFYSQAGSDRDLRGRYLDALEQEIAGRKEQYPSFFSGGDATLFIGGGNPALLDEEEIERLAGLTGALGFRYTEATVEANPDSLTREKMQAWSENGINRISLGVQSFDDTVLSFLGRSHSAATAAEKIEIAASRFNNFSIDLIGGIPPAQAGERNWGKEFGMIEKLNPPHISFYLLTVERGSAFYGTVAVDEDEQGEDYDRFCTFVAQAGYAHYEISNFAKNGMHCRHNELYWDRGEYMGFGPSAVSSVRTAGGSEMRISNAASLGSYLKLPLLCEIEQLDGDAAYFETLFLALRTARGIDLEMLYRKFPERSGGLASRLIELEKAGFVEAEGGRWRIPEKHMIVSNEIIVELTKEQNYA